MNLPLMNLHERVLSVLGCRYADDVLIDAPYVISNEMISALNIAEVVRAKRESQTGAIDDSNEVRYRSARAAGIFTSIQVGTDFRIGTVIQRIQRNQAAFQARFERKMKAEQEYMQSIAKT